MAPKKRKESVPDPTDIELHHTPSRKTVSKNSLVGSSRVVSEVELNDLKHEVNFNDHQIPLETFYLRYHTNPTTGLTSAKAAQILERDGLNKLTPPKTTSEFVKFLQHMFYGFSLVLWLGCLLCLIAYLIEHFTKDEPNMDNIYLGSVILVIVVVSGIFSYFQDRSSSKIMESFEKMMTHIATVIRDGKVKNINAEHLVRGDVVLVKFGNKVPADIRIIECFGMKVDNSSLTGETEPMSRSVECTNDNPMETQNLAFYSTNVVEGTCKGIVFQTGDRTIIGRLATLTVGLKSVSSPINKEIHHFVVIITCTAVFFSAAFFIAALSLGYTVINAFIYMIAILVANVPEDLYLNENGEIDSSLIKREQFVEALVENHYTLGLETSHPHLCIRPCVVTLHRGIDVNEISSCGSCKKFNTTKGQTKIEEPQSENNYSRDAAIDEQNIENGADNNMHFSSTSKVETVGCSLQQHITRSSKNNIVKLQRRNVIISRQNLPKPLHQCDVCQKQFSNKYCLEKHVRIHWEKKPYVCKECQKSFSQKGNLKIHMLIHSGKKEFKCNICLKEFLRKNDLQLHSAVHLEERLSYQCNECQKIFKSKDYLKSHILRHMSPEKPFKCNVCSSAFYRKDYLKNHMQNHLTAEKRYKCSECPKSYTLKSNLNHHLRIHSGIKPYACHQCQMRFYEEIHLKNHMRVHSEEKKPYKCEECNKCYSQKCHLNAHMRIHSGEAPFKCNECQREFQLKNSLRFHMQKHSAEKLFECDKCKMTFHRNDRLRDHLRFIHHSGAEEPYKCTVCQRIFAKKHSLSEHMATHSGEKSYKCPECPKSYYHENVLKRHVELHSNGKRYKCKECPKSYSYKSGLRVHLQAHSVEKEYKCNDCQKTFHLRSSLVKHVQVHFRIKDNKCDICQKQFVQKRNLNAHLRSHSKTSAEKQTKKSTSD